MKRLSFTKLVLGAATLASAFVLSTSAASAIPYDGSNTQASPVPAFNVFTGSMPAPAPLDGENDFFQARVPANGDPNDGTTPFTDPVSTACTNGKLIQLHVYVHNGASADGNDNGSGPSVAHGTIVKVALPGSTDASSFLPTATISASNAATATDNVAIHCSNGQTAHLEYVAGSASQFSNGSGVLHLSDAIVGSGVPIQSEHTAGDVWGCWNERVYVVLSVKVVVTPPKPAPVLKCLINSGDFTVDNETRKVSLKVTAVAQNATVTGYKIDWGDHTAPSTSQSASHTYGTGVSKATITASFTVKEQAQPVSGSDCVRTVSFTTTPPPPVTPPVLPNTGAGSVASLFGAATVIGGLGYRWLLGRRLSRD